MTDCERNANVSKTLTEQWKSGELKFGAYYVNRLEEHRIWLYNDRSKTPESQHEIYEILAPVPSYKEWQAKDKENQQLKELLHQCKYELISCYTDVGEEDFSLLTKIENAIGEKKCHIRRTFARV